MNKTCKKCGVEKDVSNFSKQTKAADGYFVWCKDCSKEYRYNRYYSNLEESRRKTNERRAERIRWIREFKAEQPCKDCGKIYEPFCMDYDHRPEEIKIKNISRMVLDNTPKTLIFKEIEKCDLVCVYCHNKRTHERKKATKYKSNQLRNIEIINDFKSQPCSICFVQYEHYNMQLDHIDPFNSFDYVCNLKNYKEETLINELSKCRVLCAMCHRRKSLIEQKCGYYLNNVKKPVSKKKTSFYDEENKKKECTVCHDVKSFDDFYNQKKAKHGLSPACRDCLNLAKKKKRGTLEKASLLSENKKRCTKCEEVKDFELFNKRTDGGLASWCKDCYNEYRRNRRTN